MTQPSPNTNPNPSPPPVPLAPGFRFHPTDEELVIYYLKRKILNRPLKLDAIAEIDLYKLEPWELPTKSRIRSRDLEWYFFSPLDRKYSNKSRTNRATKEGYWKTTGKDREVKRGEKIVGMKKTLVFHMGRAPSGKRTNWVMHEYRIEGDGVLDELSAVVTDKTQELYVVCRIFQKMGSGPQNGAQYGAPFIEEEWEQETGGDEPMAALMAVEKDEEDEDHEYTQMHDPSPTQTAPNPDPSLANTDLDAIPNPTNQPIKQEIEENTNENQETTNESYIVSEWAAQDTSSWPLRTRGDQSLPNSSEDNTTLSELLNVEEFFNDTIEDDDNGSNCETGQENDSIKPALLCDYEYLGAEEDEGKTVFYDVDDNAEVSDGRYLDDLMAYFDETEVDIKYDISKSSQIIEESKNVVEETKEMYKGESSSSVKPSFEETNQLKRKTFEMSDFEDIHGDEYNDKSSIRKRLVSMLGSISAPAAIASEFSASSSKMTNPNSAGPIRVTAGIIQIINLQRDDESFLMGTKNQDMDLVLKLDPVDKMDEVAVFTVFRGGFYLCFVSMAILTLSYKLSMCIYGR